MTYVLGFDTALGGCSVGLMRDGDLLAARQVETARDQAKILIPLIGEVLEEGGIDYPAIDLLVSTVGPGSFTGLRLGLSTVRSLALALSKPAVGVTTLEVLAHQAAADNDGKVTILGVLETKRHDFYVQLFDPYGAPLSTPQALELVDIPSFVGADPVILIGDAVNRFQTETGGKLNVSREINRVLLDPLTLCRRGVANAERHGAGQADGLLPVYLRGADVSVAKTPPRRLSS